MDWFGYWLRWNSLVEWFVETRYLASKILIPNTYYLDVIVTSNLEVTTIKNAVQFDIISQVELRKGQ